MIMNTISRAQRWLRRRRIGLLMCCSFFLVLPAHGQIRPPVVAGQFYPNDPVQLASDIERMLQDVPTPLVDGEICGLVAPHAGYQYSAATAAAAYKQVQDEKYDIVVIIAPSHRDSFRGATIFPGRAYETPLGTADIDVSLARQLVDLCDQVHLVEYGHRAEHAVEVQVPFVQFLFPKAKIIPLVVGHVDWSACEAIGKSLAKVLGDKKTLIIASTDLYHGQSYGECVRICGQTLSAIVALQPKTLYQELQSGSSQACGGCPVIIMQIAAQQRGANAAELLAQTNSNDVIGQKGGYVVGYGAVAVYRSQAPSGKIEFAPLDIEDQRALVRLARAAIVQYLEKGTVLEAAPVNDVQRQKRGVFVTITKNGQLRGCIGHHEPTVPLYQLVPHMALAAAFDDPRFPALRADELDDIKIKVSVYLTNVYKIDSLAGFKMGVHGIIMRKGGHAATFLPEVPVEAGWRTVEEEMVNLCQKAGLPPGAWRQGAEFWLYRTQVFDENILVH
ncbi:AmmeMemoRadiSam system protein B [candidate division KSB1 bacterium]|nr:MAG: AmmeMemoRadiSam system protein B [candidate division KSB1 bacterium]